ncbi:hypothetical protein NX059_007764 [Plenodomus lindquistii]|nr:hypothetical protein NX059_007764 [Plenodomus lindquistii]
MENANDRFAPPDTNPSEARPSKRQRTSMQPAREVGLMRSNPGESLSKFVGSASGIYFIRSVYGAIRRARPTDPTLAETSGSDIVPGEDDHLPTINPNSSKSLWRDGEVTTTSPRSYLFQEFVDWSGSYFVNWHPFYPFLHAPSVLDYFDKIARNGLPKDDSSDAFQMIVLRSILSISLIDHRQASRLVSSPYPQALVFSSYDAAVDSLRYILSSPTSLPALQATLSVQLFLVSMLRLNAASRLGGLIIRMAMQIGLHRCPYRFSAFSSSEKELRQRIFWSIYAIDRFICQSMGLPLGIHDDDVDVCYPAAESHMDHSHESSDKLCLLDLVARQSTIRGDIMELRNKSLHFVQKDPNRATAITAQIAQWWNDVEEYKDRDGQPDTLLYSSTVLTVLRHELIISLHRPILSASSQGPMYDAALQQCIGSARSIITALHQAVITKQDSDQEKLSIFWPSSTWAVWISTFILFYAASGGHIAQSTVTRSRLAERSLQLLEHFSRRGSVWPEASSAAIRDLLVRMTDSRQRTVGDQDQNLGASDTNVFVGASTAFPSETMPASGNDAVSTENDSTNRGTGDPSQSTLNQTEAPATTVQGESEDVPSTFDVLSDDWNDLNGFNSSLYQGDSNNFDSFSGFDIPFWYEQDPLWV